jgi:hypothetical protein
MATMPARSSSSSRVGRPSDGVECPASAVESDPPPAAAPIESPYDPQARYRDQHAVTWIGYIVHLGETCEDDAVHLLTQATTTTAAVHEAQCTAAIHQALARQGSPWENGYVESFNARLRDELLDGEIFHTLREAEVVIESWRRHHNAARPHASLGFRPPAPEVFVPALAAWPAALRQPAAPGTPTVAPKR